MTTLHIDIETRSTVELKTAGAHVYMEDPTTDLWCAAYAFDDEPVQLWTPDQPCPERIRQHVEAGGEIAAWNAQFERLAWRHILTPRYRWPKPKLEQFRCVMVEAMAMSLPGALEQAAPAVGIAEEKDQVGKRIMLQMSRPRKVEGGKIVWWDDAEKRQRLYDYCKQDVEVERQIEKRLVRLSPAERQVYLLDQRVNDRGVHVDADLCRAALRVVDAATAKLDAEMAKVTDRDVTACGQVSRLIVWLRQNGVDTESVAKAEMTDLLGRDDLAPHVRRALELRQEAAKASTAKIETLLSGVSQDGTVKGLLQYHGAGRTGRWAGRRFQPQNLPRPTLKKVTDSDLAVLRRGDMRVMDLLYGSPMTFVADCIRSLLVAPPSKQIIAADFANIEGRVLAWLAGQHDKVRIFAENGPIYERMAARIYNIDVAAVGKDSAERQLGKAAELGCIAEGTLVLTDRGLVPIEYVTPDHLVFDGSEWVRHAGLLDQGEKPVIEAAGLWMTADHLVLRGGDWVPAGQLASDQAAPRVAKTYDLLNAGPRNRFTCWGSEGHTTVHNCGYGMGAPKFQETCRKQGIVLDPEMAQHTIKTFRDVNHKIVDFWYATERAAIDAVEKKGAVTESGRIKYRTNGSFLWCRLPSGRVLCYPYPKIIEKETPWGEVKPALAFKGVDTYTRQWGETDTYGAKLVENVTQAVARDLMAEAMLRLETAGYEILLTVHDEIVAINRDGGSVAEFCALMAKVPTWAQGCPVAAEGWLGTRYRK